MAKSNGQSGNTAMVEANGTLVRGLTSRSGDVDMFLGIPFARVVQRFRPAQPVSLASLGPEVDATVFGPRCPQSWNHGPQRRKHLYEGIPLSSNHPVSESDCLNLNVYAPAQGKGGVDRSSLPVLVWIHGGGWVFGDGGSEYDGTFLVQEACRLGKPFIFVTLNYRLGYYGFLSSRELRIEAEGNGEVYCPNPGLLDQRVALQWVQDNITHFGGDATKCTVAGQSAGAWSALSHLVTNKALCQRGLIMSATVLSFPTEDESQAIFDKLVSRAGLSPVTSSAQEKLAALRSLSDEQMTAWLDGAVLLRPSWDPEWFTSLSGVTPSRLDQVESFPEWVKGIVIGSTKDETANIRPFWQPHPVEAIVNAVKSVVPDQTMADELLQTYGLISSSSHEEVLDGLVHLTTESFFGLFPPQLGGQHATPPISVYRFEQPDTFEQSSYRGKAYHCLDLPFLCRLPAVAGTGADAAMRSTSDAVTEAVAKFVHGQQPWESFHTSQSVMVFNGPDSEVKNREEERWRRFFDNRDRSTTLVDTGRLLMTFDLAKLAAASKSTAG